MRSAGRGIWTRAALAIALAGWRALAGAAPAAADLSPLDLVVISPALPSQLDAVQVVVNGIGGAAPTFAAPAIDGGSIALVGKTPPSPAGAGSPAHWTVTIDLGALSPGSYTLEVILDGGEYLTQSFTVREAAAVLSLVGGRFAVTVTRPESPAGGSAAASPVAGHAVKLGDGAGYFWFYDSADIELTVKILDGRPVDGHFWVFIASMTDQPYAVAVTDTAGSCVLQPVTPPPCPTRNYLNPAHVNQNFIDVEAF